MNKTCGTCYFKNKLEWELPCARCKVCHPNSNFDDKWCLNYNDKSVVNSNISEDVVNHPKHYKRDEGMECIDEMVLVFGKEWVQIFCLLNVWKYRYRAADKDGQKDLKKSDQYMRKYKELSEPEHCFPDPFEDDLK